MSQVKPSPSSRARADEFLRTSHLFRLGSLTTETENPLTRNLSDWAESDLLRAIAVCKQVEASAIDTLLQQGEMLARLAAEMRATIDGGGRIIFCGCGATGRLSLSLESLWRECISAEPRRNDRFADQVLSFMAGGDYALVRSIENFEDHPEYGARQLRDIGFRDGDLLVASTEGGETPFVIGAVEEAASLSQSLRRPWFLFCNSKEELITQVERSKRVLENPLVTSVSIESGPMTVAGSTRMQASTVLMLAAGSTLLSLLENVSPMRASDVPLAMVKELSAALADADFKQLVPLIEKESAVYQAGQRCLHVTGGFAITVLTDTTERSPTFSLLPFENMLETNPLPALTFLSIPETETAEQAWRQILQRPPRALDWPELAGKYDLSVVYGFDFSHGAKLKRSNEIENGLRHEFVVKNLGDKIIFSIGNESAEFARTSHPLIEHILVKTILNTCSTLTMARLGRVRGNLMIDVKPSNNKLIDRAIRIIRQVLQNENCPVPSYEDTCYALFQVLETSSPGDAPVPLTIELLK